ncbi:MAG: GNAT family N-acetyltransferase [Eubacteriales bacterium]|nr:GNAT family N-acetyltransferase [Eubacteriales bacterium]
MNIVTYGQEYEQAVVALWNRELTADPIIVQKFRSQVLLDDNFDSELCYIALEEGQVVGFLLATKRKFPYLERGTEPERGWINVMFVDRRFQRRGIGSQLLDTAETALKTRGARQITLAAYSPSYVFPGVDVEQYAAAVKFFQRHGYVGGKMAYSMCKDLHGYRLAEETKHRLEQAQEAGYRFEMFTWPYAVELLNYARDEFGGGWKRNCLLAMQQNRAEDCIFLVLDQDNRICGFCTRMIDGNPMRFGPIGVSATARNHGLGGLLFDLYQFEMAKRGICHLYFVSTDDPGRRFYERHGVRVFRTFQDYRKELTG